MPWGGDEFGLGETSLNFERIVLDPTELPDGFVLHAYAWPELETGEAIAASVLVTRDSPGAPTLLPEPRIPGDLEEDPLSRAVGATVLVYGPTNAGSGVLLSPEGHVVTNAHVVSGAGNQPTPSGLAPLAIGFTLDPRRAPTPTLGARLLDYREDLDLALLRIQGALDGAPLPPGTRFPWIELTTEEPTLGMPLTSVGYPASGGSSSFVTITVTRGIFSGFSREWEGLLYKTDAALHAGMSGGACLDERGRLLGLPMSALGDSGVGGALGYVVPAASIPEHWRETFGLRSESGGRHSRR